MADNKISNMLRIEAFDGDEIAPLVKNGSNYAATFDALREYFRDSVLVVFNSVSDVNPQSISDLPLAREEGAIYAIIYLTKKKLFVEGMYYGGQFYYTTNFARWQDFLTETTVDGVTTKAVRADKVFLNLRGKELYMFNGDLHNLFDTVRINAMTEEEFSKLENPIEGAFYATYEE